MNGYPETRPNGYSMGLANTASVSMQGSNNISPPKEMSEIEQELAHYEMFLEELDMEINQLAGKLAPVLAAGPDSLADPKNISPRNSVIARRLNDYNNRLGRFASSIRSLRIDTQL